MYESHGETCRQLLSQTCTEDVIKMIMKGRSPTMRHVSRTHRVALELFLILKFKFDMSTPHINSQTFLTKGNFTRDEWNNLLHLFNISHFSSTCCVQTLHVSRTCSLHFFLAWRTDTNTSHGVRSVYVISLHLALSVLMFHPPSLLFPHGHFDTMFTSAPSSSSVTRPRSAGPAHPRTCAGGWLPGRSHALDRLWAQGVRQDYFCRWRHDAS